MRKLFNTGNESLRSYRPAASQTPRIADAGHVRGVDATSGGLIRATAGSAVAAGAILLFAWLPAEYGIDPTGVGSVLGLTDMGEIKQQLYAEAADEDPPLAAQEAPADADIAKRLERIEAQIAAVAGAVGAQREPESSQAAADATASGGAEAPPGTGVPSGSAKRDEISHTLAPGEGVEIKLAMDEGAVAEFEWSANGAVLNHDTHGDGGGESVMYERGRGVPGQEGELVAEFTGNHGWFWRNRTDEPVTFTLRTRGEYTELIRP